MTAPRPTDLVRWGLGAAALARPESLLRLIGPATGAAPGAGSRRVTQVLGARYVVQGVLTARWDRVWLRAGGAGVDLLHAVSMLALAAVEPPRRRAALGSAAVAAGLAAADLRSISAGFHGSHRSHHPHRV